MAAVFGAPLTAYSAPFVCLASVGVLDAVYHDGSDHVARASAASTATAPAVGLVARKLSPTSCILVYKGEMPGFVGLVPASMYYLDVAAGQIATSPTGTVGTVLQRIGWARNSTTLVVEIDLDYQQL